MNVQVLKNLIPNSIVLHLALQWLCVKCNCVLPFPLEEISKKNGAFSKREPQGAASALGHWLMLFLVELCRI